MQLTPINSANSLLSSSEMHLAPIVNFQTNFNSVCKTNNALKILEFLEEFMLARPMSRDLVKQVHKQFKQIHGFEGLASEVASMIAEATVRQCRAGQKECNLPALFESFNLLETSAHMVAQARSTKLLFDTGILYEKPSICIGDNMSKTILAFKPYLDDFFKFVTDPNELDVIKWYQLLVPFSTEYFYHSQNISGHFSEFFSITGEEMRKKNVHLNCFSLKENTQIIASRYLREHNVIETEPFVVTFIDKPSPENIHNLGVYSDSLDLLTKSGLKIFNFGNAVVSENNNVINFKDDERPFEVDIFLTASAEFYFGPKNGTSELASSFGTPSCIISGTEIDSADPYAFVDFKQILHKQNLEPLSKEKMTDLNITLSTGPEILTKLDLQFKKPVSIDVLKAVKEMIDRMPS